MNIYLSIHIYGGFHSHGGTPSHHPFRMMGFSIRNHPFWGPPFQETPIYIYIYPSICINIYIYTYVNVCESTKIK